MSSLWRTALTQWILLSLICGVIYPAVVTAVAQLGFSAKANGSLVRVGDRVVGSELIGQPFDAAMYFWCRPSATPQFPYNGAASSGSNYGPLNPALLDRIANQVSSLRQAHPSHAGPLPVDLVTASGSGLDPHISPAAAFLQVARVATARELSEESVRALVQNHVERSSLGLLGEPRVNVLRLNLALDEFTATYSPGQPQPESR